jgi:hypothetical protein
MTNRPIRALSTRHGRRGGISHLPIPWEALTPGQQARFSADVTEYRRLMAEGGVVPVRLRPLADSFGYPEPRLQVVR